MISEAVGSGSARGLLVGCALGNASTPTTAEKIKYGKNKKTVTWTTVWSDSSNPKRFASHRWLPKIEQYEYYPNGLEKWINTCEHYNPSSKPTWKKTPVYLYEYYK